jgi:hypothetical protein
MEFKKRVIIYDVELDNPMTEDIYELYSFDIMGVSDVKDITQQYNFLNGPSHYLRIEIDARDINLEDKLNEIRKVIENAKNLKDIKLFKNQ